MSARDDIAYELWMVMPAADDAAARAMARGLIDAYRAEVRHEAAEEIRAKCRDLYGSPNALRPGIWADEGYGLLDAADLIDPEDAA